ncbi:MAG: lipid-A-disaccharide synthase [Candidatus Krumholzibacteriia bacterium]
MTPSPDARAPHVFLSCGEASGDRYGAALAAALRRRRPGLRLTAVGGPALAAAGAEIIQASGPLAVMGFGEVLGALPRLVAAHRRVARHLARGGIDLCVPVDFPGFNLRIAAAARRRGIPVFYLVAPQLWAWGAWRLPGLRRAVDRLGVILPFEPDWFATRGVAVVALGHPLVEDYPEAAAREGAAEREARLAAPDAPLTLGLLPGSRRQELAHLLPELLGAATRLRARLAPRPLRCVVSAAPGLDRRLLEAAARQDASVSTVPLTRLLPELDLALVCSGTASLEAALAGVPHEVVYRTSPFSYAIARRLVRVPYIGLANLVLGEPLVREHIQAGVTAEGLAAALGDWLTDPARRRRFAADVQRLRARLGPPGAWDRAAEAALALLDARAAAGAPAG